MKLEYFHYKLQFRHPFELSLSTRSHTDLVIVKLSHNNYMGYGEASLPPHFKEDSKKIDIVRGNNGSSEPIVIV